MKENLMRRILIDREPFIDRAKFKPGWAWSNWGDWPAWWVDHPERPLAMPSVAVFRLKFKLDTGATLRLHVSADNRYRIFLDGHSFGHGPERGDVQHWFFETYEGEVPAGEHTLSVQTWWLGEKAPYAQMSVRPGFMLAAEGAFLEQMSTGHAKWETALMPGIEFIQPGNAWGAGWNVRVDGPAYPWGWENGGDGLGWRDAQKITEAVSSEWKNETRPYWMLAPAALPPMLDEPADAGVLRHLAEGVAPYPVSAERHLSNEAPAWKDWLSGHAPVHIPAGTGRTVLIDLENYYCAYPELLVSGGKGTRIRLQWAEGLFLKADGGGKGRRDETEGKFFYGGTGDEFLPDGGEKRLFTTLWWQAGRYLELTVTTGDLPVTLERLSLRSTGYPLKMEGRFDASDRRFSRLLPIAERAMQMCSHETYMDCPYYEQLMYVGDTRLEVLTTYAMTPDTRLPRKAMLMFDWSRRNSGFTQSRYPSRVCQIIPPFSLWWICMIHDYWTWRNDEVFVKERMPGVRAVTEAFRSLLRPDGLIGAPNGWNFTDWVKEPLPWQAGIPPEADFAPSSVLNLHFALVLVLKAEMEASFGEHQLAERDRATATMLTDAVMRTFWDEEKGLIADDSNHKLFSEHAQCLALLGGLPDEDKRRIIGDSLCSTPGLSKTTIYFAHYLFETYRLLGRDELFLERLELWFQLPEHGFKTTFEEPEPSRSDCHAWGAHPLFHCYATILGIRPDAPGFSRVRIAPMPGRLKQVSGTLPHPRGEIEVKLERGDGDSLDAVVRLPTGIAGVFAWKGMERQLKTGRNILKF
ncbi:MAG: alpha-L-rhamnosidase C-terminal domain-containing protein [Victivallales bacterium]